MYNSEPKPEVSKKPKRGGIYLSLGFILIALQALGVFGMVRHQMSADEYSVQSQLIFQFDLNFFAAAIGELIGLNLFGIIALALSLLARKVTDREAGLEILIAAILLISFTTVLYITTQIQF